MKKDILYTFFILLFLPVCFVSMAQGNFISIKGKKFVDGNGNEFFPVMLNYWLDIVYDDAAGQYFISPQIYYGNNTTCNIQCPTPPVCWEGCPGGVCNQQLFFQQMENDFIFIKSLGYNSLRVVGFGPIYEQCPDINTTNNVCDQVTYSAPAQKCFTMCRFPKHNCCGCQKQPFPLIPMPTYISMLQGVLDAAGTAGLKVLLSVGAVHLGDLEDPNGPPDLQAVQEYSNYLASIAQAFAGDDVLLGYDLFTEPGGFSATRPRDGINAKKQFICDATEQWYNTIKLHAPNHLVTIGLQEPPVDLHEWDYGITALDFHSFHVYPWVKDPRDSAEKRRAIDGVFSYLKWYGENVRQPWMLGETGFSASDTPFVFNCTIGGGNPTGTVSGNKTDQFNYFVNLYRQVRDNGGAGLAIWQYHDVWWSDSGAMCLEDGFGIMDRDNNPKPAAFAFQNISYFNQPPVTPGNYYNIIGAKNNCVSGNIKESVTNLPLKDISLVGFPPRFEDGWGNTSTFSKQDGSFEMCNNAGPFDPTPNSPGFNNKIDIIRVSGVGTNTYDHTPVPNPPATNLILPPLTYSSTHKNINLNGVLVFPGQNKFEETYNNISANNYFISGGGNVEFKAGGEITLKEFTVARGGEFHAKYGLPLVNCNEQIFSQRIQENTSINQVSPSGKNQTTVFTLKPETKNKDFKVSQWAYLFPNPTMNGVTELNISDALKFSEIIITDLLGKTVHHISVQSSKMKIDISRNPRGIYFVRIIGAESILVKKLIYQ